MHSYGLSVVLFALVACKGGTGGEHKPTGTPTDPVTTCERPAQVCKYKGSQLGVCVSKQSSDPDCKDRSPCFVCAPQH
jgi:hypothetical protein